jgi:predicted acetyltransferase
MVYERSIRRMAHGPDGRRAEDTVAEADDVEVRTAAEIERPLLEGLMQFYLYDFSELEPADSPEFELEANGLFKPYKHLGAYWREPGRIPLMISKRGLPVGFALLHDHSHSGMPVDHNMAEFFVVRKHRRGGVASAAVARILAAYPGRWEIAIVERNLGAQAFWPKAIAAAPGVKDLHPMTGDGVQWSGPIYRFVVAP